MNITKNTGEKDGKKSQSPPKYVNSLTQKASCVSIINVEKEERKVKKKLQNTKNNKRRTRFSRTTTRPYHLGLYFLTESNDL